MIVPTERALRCLLVVAVAGWIGCSGHETTDNPEPQVAARTSGAPPAAAVPAGAVAETGGTVCTPNQMWDCYSAPLETDGIGACQRGRKTCDATGSAWGECVGEVTPTAEVCGDAVDNDCDGTVDEDCGPTCIPTTEVCGDHADNDCDGNIDEGCLCDPGAPWTCYSGPLSTDGIGACQRGTKTCSADGMSYGACIGEITPVTEVCGDHVDNDCDGATDEGCPVMRLLTVLKSGTGTGTVTSAPSGINCGATCTATFLNGTLVTLTPAPAPGSVFTNWSGACTGSGACVVTMNAARTVTAKFSLATGTQPLTVTRAGTGTGTVTSAPAGINCGATCSASYATGTVVTLTAAPAVGSLFTGWSGGGCTGTGTCAVTMTAATTVTATFTLATYPLTVARAGSGTGTVTSSPTGINCGATCSAPFLHGTLVTLTAAPSADSTFDGWSGGGCTGTGTCTVTMTAATTVTATFTLATYPLTVARAGSGTGTVSSAPAGLDCGATCTASYATATVVTLTAVAAPGSRFDGWSGGGCTGTGTCTVTMTAATSVTATFTAYHALAVLRAGSGTGTVASAPAGIDCGATCAAEYDQGTVVTLTATAAPGSRFDGWSGGGCAGTGTCEVVVSAATTVTATFTAFHTLAVARDGSGTGTVTSAPLGIDCGVQCNADFDDGTAVTLTAIAGPGARFDGWSGAGCTGTGTCTVTMSAATSVTATFTAFHALAVTRAGSGTGTVASAPAGIDCGATCSADFDDGTVVSLTATAAPGSQFVGWSGSGCVGTGTCVVTMDTARAVTATFLREYSLTVARTGAGTGAVTSSPSGIDCGASCSADFLDGTLVTLIATAAPGSRFDGWAGSGCTGTGSCVVAMSAARTVTASFGISSYPLTVNRTGSGTGTVTSAPAGIDCGATCTALFAPATVVTLTAAAAPGSRFDGWSGAGCSGTGTCTVTIADATEVTAAFTRLVTLTVIVEGSGRVTSLDGSIDCGADCSTVVDLGATVDLTGVPDAGFVVKSWTGATGCTGATCAVVLLDDLTVTVRFGLVTLTVVPEGTGTGLVESSPTGIDCGADCSEDVPVGTTVTLTPTADPGATFDGWTGPCLNLGDEAGGGPTPTGNGCTDDRDPDADGLFGCADPDCTGEPYCTTCGNGVIDADETCDDGNRTRGDGCNSSCRIESGFTCRFPGRPCVGTMCEVAAVGTSGFARNNYVEIGLGRNGAFGTSFDPSPNGWHWRSNQVPREIGFVADPEGTSWTNYHGDFFVPGTPEEGWAMVVGNTVYNNNRVGTTTMMAGEIAEPECVANLCGARDGARVHWSSLAPVGGAVDVQQDYTILDGGVFILVDVYLTNVSGSNLTNVYYMRNVDPDNDQSRHGIYTTTNNVLAQPNATSDLAQVRATQNYFGAPPSAISIVARDSRARVTFGGFSNRDPRLVWNGTGGLHASGGNVADEAISIAFKVDIPVGETVGFRFAYNLESSTSDVLTCVHQEAPNLCVVRVDQDTEVRARFTRATAPLDVTLAGTGTGTVTSVPAGIDCGAECRHDFDKSTLVTLIATPAPGSRFGGWSGHCAGLGTCVVTMNGARHVTATFIDQVALDVTTVGDGTVYSSPAGITCGTDGTDCHLEVDSGTYVYVEAVPGPGMAVSTWEGYPCTGSSCWIYLADDTAITVTFAPTVPLTVVKDGTGDGFIYNYDVGISCGFDCEADVGDGAEVVLAAEPDFGVRLDWEGCAEVWTEFGEGGEVSFCRVLVTGPATEVRAHFSRGHYLYVSTAGSGSGHVTSAPAGIDCPWDCQSLFAEGDLVELTAVADPNSRFVGWGITETDTYAAPVVPVAIPDGDLGGAEAELEVPLSRPIESLQVSFTITHPDPSQLEITLLHDGFEVSTLWWHWFAGSPFTQSVFLWYGGDSGGRWSLLVRDPSVGDAGTIDDFTIDFHTPVVVPTLDPILITDHDVTVVPIFESAIPLQVAKVGTGGGVVTSEPAGIDCGPTCTAIFGAGQLVLLTATPDPDSGFAGWSGACAGPDPWCYVTLWDATDVTATFTRGHELEIVKAGTGAGRVTADQGGLDCGDQCIGIVDGPVTLTAEAEPGSVFVGWFGPAGCSGTGPCTTTLVADSYVIAVFDVEGPALAITFAGDGSGVVDAVPGTSCDTTCTHSYALGTALFVTASPSFDSEFVGWEGDCTGTGPCLVTMDVPHALTARFALRRYPLDVALDGTGTGTVTSTPPGIDCGADCSEDYLVGTAVELVAVAGPGTRFGGWTGDCATTEGDPTRCSIGMDGPRYANATFIAQQALSVAVSGAGRVTSDVGLDCGFLCSAVVDRGANVVLVATPEPGYAVASWSVPGCSGNVCSVAVDSDLAVTVTFAPTATLQVARAGAGSGRVTSAPAGIDCGFLCSATFGVGQTFTLTATADPGSTFAGWSGACSGTGPCVVTLAAGVNAVTASFTTAYTLTVSRLGNGTGVVVSAPAGLDCGATCTATFPSGTVVTLTATATDGSVFTRWEDGSTSSTRVVVMNSNRNLAAIFTADFTLSVAKTGSGNGTLYEATFGFTCDESCGSFSGTHLGPGFPVHLTATPAAGSVFVGWEGACSGTGPCDVVMTGNTTIRAHFSRTHTLTIVRAGPGSGRVVSTPPGLDCGSACSATVREDDVTNLTAIADPGSVFVGWSPVTTGCSGNTCALTVVTDTTLTATFAPAVALTVDVIAGAGVAAVRTDPGGALCTSSCTVDFAHGTTVTVTPIPAAGLAAWSGDCSGAGTCSVVMTATRHVSATFRPRHPLVVTKVGAGAGTVTSTPAAIDCGPSCSADYFEGETVTLTAVPDGTSAFLGWEGACTNGFGPCTVTIAGATLVQARFDAWQDPTLVAIPPLPPFVPDPDNAQYDSTGHLIVATGENVTITVDRTPSAVTALQTCAQTIVNCVRAGAGSIDECTFSMPRCATETPWTEATGCCAPACWDGFREERRLGADPIDALDHALFGRPSCMPGVDAVRGGDSGQPASSFAQDMLTVHNQKRARHCVPPLEWSTELEAGAQAYANVLLATRIWEHSPEARAGLHGENLEFDTNPLMLDVWRANLWYEEIAGYDWSNPGNALPGYTEFDGQIGHFTQWVWKRNQTLGCGKATDGTTTYLVCKYGPGGNVPGDYERNVLPVCAP